jgi:PPK2 family polyphosphate:nucleotide phosphotransferase
MTYAQIVRKPKNFKLKDYDPGDHDGLEREKAEEQTEALGRQMAELHDLLFAAGQNGLLIVLQGMDTSGKDGLIRSLLTHINAQSCRVIPFKVPSERELAHDFLWRIHAETPGRGTIAIFNRSYYEDVLVVRVHKLIEESVWKRRYDHINNFERLLLDSGTIILKFFLHISKDEQEERLLAREKDPTKSWKLSVADWKEREVGGAYQKADEDAIMRCSPDVAPWHVVPANHKWFRNLAVTERIVDALSPYREPWMEFLETQGAARKKELEAFRAAHNAK